MRRWSSGTLTRPDAQSLQALSIPWQRNRGAAQLVKVALALRVVALLKFAAQDCCKLAAVMTAYHRRSLATTCTLLICALPTLAFSQTQMPRVEAGAAFGAGSLDGISGGIPPAAQTLMGAIRLSVGAPVRGVRVSAETEVNFSGASSGRGPDSGNIFVLHRETRRDVLWSLLGGIQVWEPHRIGSVHVVAGLTYVRPVVAAATQTFGKGGWGDWIDTDVSYHSTWAATLGADVSARFGRVSVGPSFRWYGYVSNPSPYEIGRPTRSTLLGLAASYHF
jgi:hypothetical protein